MVTLNWGLGNCVPMIQQALPSHWLKVTLPVSCRNVCYDPSQCLRFFEPFSSRYRPYMHVWPEPPTGPLPPAVALGSPFEYRSCLGNALLMPPLHDLDRMVDALFIARAEVTVITPLWQNAPWFARALGRCFEYELLRPETTSVVSVDTSSVQWALVAFHLLHDDDPPEHGHSLPPPLVKSMSLLVPPVNKCTIPRTPYGDRETKSRGHKPVW